MLTALILVTVVVSALVALPGDWARRLAGPRASGRLNLVNGLAVATLLAAVASLGLVHGLGAMLALASAAGSGQQLANALAERLWGTVQGA